MSKFTVSTHPITGEKLFMGFSKRQWSILLIFGIADLFAGIVYSIQAPFYPQEAEKKGASPLEFGLVFGIFELTIFIASPIFGRYMTRLGAKRVFITCIFITGICCILFGLLAQINDHTWFVVMSFLIRTLEACGNAGFSTASFTIIATEFRESVATTFASLETFFGLGLIAGPSLGGSLYQLGGYILPFAVTGGILFLNGTLIAIFMPRGNTSAEETEEQSKEGFNALSILKIPGVMLAAFAIITAAFSIGFLGPSLEPHIRQFDLSPVQVGLVFVIHGGVYAFSAPGWGWICDRIKEPKYVTLIGGALITVGFSFIGPVPFIPIKTTLWFTCVGLTIHGIGVGAAFVSSFILALRHSIAAGFPDNVATYSVVSGMWSSVLALGLFIGPSIAGYLYELVGFPWASVSVVGVGGLLVVAVLGFLLIAGRTRHGAISINASSDESAPLIDDNGIRETSNVPSTSYGATVA